MAFNSGVDLTGEDCRGLWKALSKGEAAHLLRKRTLVQQQTQEEEGLRSRPALLWHATLPEVGGASGGRGRLPFLDLAGEIRG